MMVCIHMRKVESDDAGEFIEDVLKNTGVLFVPGWGLVNQLKML